MQQSAGQGSVRTRFRRAPAAVALILGFGFAGCATQLDNSAGANRGMSCLDDSAHCVSQRQAALRELVGRNDRQWVKEGASVDSYASGVRLFALKKKKKELSCDELRHAQREAHAADAALRGPNGRGLTHAQISRGSMLAAEVGREISREIARRCLRG